MLAFEVDDIRLKDIPKFEKSTAIIGNFDGLHKGHQSLIKEAQKTDYKTMVITFKNLFKDGKILQTEEQKYEYLDELGVDYLVVFDFRMIQLTFFNEFIKMLKKLNVKAVVCGEDFRFGYKREGDVFDLEKFFKVYIVDYTKDSNYRISTTLIKKELAEGKVEIAAEMLSRPYAIKGKVLAGSNIGKSLGFPTANIDYGRYILPKNGVYYCHAKYNGVTYVAMTNIGFNPTLNEQTELRLEVHIIDFDQDLYGEVVEVEFLKYLREEMKFESKEALISMLEQNKRECLECENAR